MALCLKVRECDIIHIGNDIYITFAHRRGKGKSQMMIWIEAPKDMKISRDRGGSGKLEHLLEPLKENNDGSTTNETEPALVPVGTECNLEGNEGAHLSDPGGGVVPGKTET